MAALAPADRAVFASLMRAARKFVRDQIPLTGVAGTDITFWGLDPEAHLARAFRGGGQAAPAAAAAAPAPDGLALLRRLEAQLAVLRGADEPTRRDLAEVARALRRQAARPAPPAAALEEALALAVRQARRLQEEDAPLFPEMLEGGGAGGQGERGGGGEPLDLDGLVAAVRRRHPALFPAGGGGAPEPPPGAALASARLAALAGVAYGELGLRHEPFEWVYTGVAPPLEVASVLRARRGAPLALAAAAAAAGRRLGLPLVPLPADGGGGGGGRELAPGGGALPPGLPPELAARVANSQAQGAAPPPGRWVLALPGVGGGGGPDGGGLEDGGLNDDDPVAMDAARGRLLGRADAAAAFPALFGAAAPRAAELARRAPLLAWRAAARALLQAHTRRGESERAAHWGYVRLALDAGAPEWGRALAGPELLRR